MANRTFKDKQYTLTNRPVTLWAVFTVTGTTPALQRWNYPALGTGSNVRTYTAATTSAAPPSGAGPWPLQYARGTEGVAAVARTAAGLWTVTLQDNYQRLVSLTGYQSIAGGTANIISVAENTTITSMSANGGSVIGVALLSATATLADPTTASNITLRFDLLDGTEP